MFRKLLDKAKRKGKSSSAYENFSKEYTMTDNILGQGSYAAVHKGYRKKPYEVIAVKIIDKSGLSQREIAGLDREVHILKELDHGNVVKVFDYFSDADTMYVVMEYVGGGELFKKIVTEDRPFTEDSAKKIIRTLADALQYCKNNGVIHRDIKPQNLLLTAVNDDGEGGELKLADFNLSIQVEKESVQFSLLETMCGTPNYVAPEILSQKSYDYKCDIWSLGVICFLLLSGGFLPFFVEEEGELGKDRLLAKVRKGKWGFYPAEAWASVSDEAKDFLRKVMEKDPKKRLNYEQLLSHQWMKSEGVGKGQTIDVGVFQHSVFNRQIMSASTVMSAAGRFREIMLDDKGDEAAATGKMNDVEVPGSGPLFLPAE